MGILFKSQKEGEVVRIKGDGLEISVTAKEIRGSQASREVEFDVIAGDSEYSTTLDKNSPPFELVKGIWNNNWCWAEKAG
jgi:hypothetical protein